MYFCESYGGSQGEVQKEAEEGGKDSYDFRDSLEKVFLVYSDHKKRGKEEKGKTERVRGLYLFCQCSKRKSQPRLKRIMRTRGLYQTS